MAWYRQGTVSINNGSAAVTGTTTSWMNQAKAEDRISFDGGGKWYEILSVNSNTSITLATNFAETTISGGSYAIDRSGRRWGQASDVSAMIAQLLALFPALGGAGDAGKALVADGSGTSFAVGGIPVTAAAGFAADNRLLRSDGTGRGAQASGITVDDNDAITLPNAGLRLLDTDASHALVVAPGSNLSADRTLTLRTGDAARDLDLVRRSYTPSVSALSGTFGSVSATGHFSLIGPICVLRILVIIANAGTAASGVLVSLPAGLTASENSIGTGMEMASTGQAAIASIYSGQTNVLVAGINDSIIGNGYVPVATIIVPVG